MCAAVGTWLVLDNTYEHFLYEGRNHHCISGPNVIHVFSFSKAYGMMGWRVGYIAYPGQQQQQEGGIDGNLHDEILKVPGDTGYCVADGHLLLAKTAWFSHDHSLACVLQHCKQYVIF